MPVVSVTIVSNDGRGFPISNQAACISDVLRELIEDESCNNNQDDEKSNTPKICNLVIRMVRADSATVERIVAFLNHHLEEPMNPMQYSSTEQQQGRRFQFPGANQPFYENFVPMPTRQVISALLKSAIDLGIYPLYQLIHVECVIWMIFRLGYPPSFEEASFRCDSINGSSCFGRSSS